MTLPAFLIVDVETTGLDLMTHDLIEVAAVLFDPDIGAPIESRSVLVHAPDNPAAHINRIHASGPRLYGVADARVRDMLADLLAHGSAVRGASVILAHNAAFDRQWLPKLDTFWICTYEDAVWPRVPGETGALTAIALAYDVGVVRAHRAIEDCLTLAAVLSRVHEIEGGLGAWFDRATEERREVFALVSYDDRQLAKDAGFRWDGDRKKWWKRVSVSRVEALAAELPFRVEWA
jgi:DNA polymerase-3 subunit epsilon